MKTVLFINIFLNIFWCLTTLVQSVQSWLFHKEWKSWHNYTITQEYNKQYNPSSLCRLCEYRLITCVYQISHHKSHYFIFAKLLSWAHISTKCTIITILQQNKIHYTQCHKNTTHPHCAQSVMTDSLPLSARRVIIRVTIKVLKNHCLQPKHTFSIHCANNSQLIV